MKRFLPNFFLFSLLVVTSVVNGQNDPGDISNCYNSNITFAFDPEPVDGAFEPDTDVELCVTFTYVQTAGNWIHGVQIHLPDGWDESSINPASFSTSCTGGAGSWTWQGSGTFYGNNFGIGFYYLGGALNWGQSCPNGTFTICIDVTVDPECGGPGSPLNGELILPGFSTTGDNNSTGSGGWSGPPAVCDGVIIDATVNIPTVTIDCCDAEAGTSPGTLPICNNGPFDLFGELGAPVDDDGFWTEPDGTELLTAGNSYIFDPLTSDPGDYIYTVEGDDGCLNTSIITMEFIELPQAGLISWCSSAPFTIQGEFTGLGLPFPDPTWNGTWTDPAGTILPDGSGPIVPGTNPPGIYTYEYLDGNNCPTTTTVNVNIVLTDTDSEPAASADICTSDDPFSPYDLLAGSPVPSASASWIYEPASGGVVNIPGGANAVINPANYSGATPAQPLESGFMWYFFVDLTAGCFSIDTVFIDVFDPVNTGTFTEVNLCISDPPVNLTDLLEGTPDTGLTWEDVTAGSVIPEILDPADYDENEVLLLSYSGGLEGTSCFSLTNMVITILPDDADAGEFASVEVCETDDVICLTDLLGGDPQVTGSWTSPSGVEQNCIFIPGTSEPGIWTYTVITSCDTDTQTLEVNVIDQADAGTDGVLTVCTNDTDVPLINGLGGTPDTGGEWSLGGTPVGDTVNGNSATDGAVYTYTVGTGSCQDVSTVTIDLQESPYAGQAPAGQVIFCDDAAAVDLINLWTDAPAGGTQTWSGPGGFTGSTLNPATAESGTYSLTVTSAQCGITTETVDILIESAPNAGTSTTVTACPNATADIDLLAALGGTPGGTWTAPPGGPDTGIYSPGDPAGDYVYSTASPSGQCTDLATVTVNVTALPDPGTDGAITVCEGDPSFPLFGELGGTPENTGGWTDPNGDLIGAWDAEFVPGTDDAGVYTYTVGDGVCPNLTAEVTVTVIPDANAGNNNTVTACESLGSVDLIGFLGGTPDPGGTWSVPNPYFLSGQCGTTQNISYTVDNGTCQDVAILTLTVECLPNAGGDGTLDLCSNDPCFDLETGLTGPFDAGGTWTDSAGDTVGDNQCPNTLGTGDTFTYTVDAVSCNADQAEVTVNVTPSMTAVNVDAVCEASQLTYVVSFEINGGAGPYEISGTEITGTETTTGVYTSNPVPVGTNYSFTVTDNSTCADLTVNGTSPACACPAAVTFLNGDQTVCAGSPAQLEFDVTGAAPFEIIVNDGTDDLVFSGYNPGETVAVTPAATTIYTLVSASDANCAGTADGSVTVSVEDLPDAGPDVTETLCAQGGNLNLSTLVPAGTDPGVFSGPGGDVTTVPNNPASSAVYTYTVSGTVCPDDVASYDITILPELSVTNIASECNPAQTQYTVTFDIDGGTGNYTVTGTVDGTITGNTFTSDPLDPAADLTYGFTVSDGGTCPDANVSGDAPNCACPATAALTGGSQTICAGETASLSVNLAGDGPWTLTYDAGGTTEGPITLNAGETIDVTPAATTVYSLISVSDQNCDGSVSGNVTVNVDTPPNAGPDVEAFLCEQGGNLNLNTLLDGGADGGGTFAGPGGGNVTSVPYTPASSGIYTYTPPGNACPNDDAEYDITIYEEINVFDVSATCNAAQTDYTVVFTIEGGTGNYNVTGEGTLTGNTFTSDPIAVGTNYGFTVADDGPCDETGVMGVAPNCACPASATLTGSNQTICQGETASLSLTLAGDGPWTLTYDAGGTTEGPIILNAGETIDVTPAATTTYSLTSVSDQNCDGSVSGSITVNVDSPPNAGPDVTVPPLCGGPGDLDLETLLDGAADGNGDFSIGGNVVTTVPLTSASTGVYTYTTQANACPADDATYDITIYDPIAVTNLSVECNLAQTEYTVSFIITGGTGNYTLTGETEGTLVGNTFTSDLIDGDDPYEIIISDDGPCEEVTVADANPDCDCLATGSLSGSTAICAGSSADITVTLVGVPPFSITYENSNDPGNPTTLNNIFNGHTITVNPGSSATYTLLSVSDANCTGSVEGDAVDITVDSPINAGNETITCDSTGDTYTVVFTATGGTGTLEVTNATGTGPVYTGGPFNSGQGYSITVSDQGSCPDVVLTGDPFTCPCTTEAGSLIGDGFEVCTNETVTVTGDGNEFLDGNDTFQFALHDGDADNLGNILLLSDNGTFGYDAALETGTVYFISALAGNENPQGNVDTNDPCLSVSNGLPILFYDLPTATFVADVTVCEGSEAELIVNFTGQGPWTFDYELNGTEAETGVESAGSSVVISVTEPGTYAITNISDANCSDVSGSTAEVNNFAVPTAVLGGEPEVCENSGDGPEVTFTGNGPWTFSYSINGEEQDQQITTTQNPYTIAATDAGIYALTSLNDVNCAGTVSGTLNVVLIPLPAATLTGGGSVCAGDEATFNVQVTGTGPWTVQYAVDGVAQPALTSDVPNFSFQSGMSGTYTVTSVTDAVCQGLSHDNNAALIVNQLPVGELSTSSSLLCIGEELELQFSLEGTPPFDVTYTLNADTFQLNGLTASHTVTLNPEVALMAELVFIEDGSNPSCSAAQNESIFVQVTELPNAPVLTDDTICSGQGPVPIGTVSGPGLSYEWTPTTGLSDPKVPNPTVTLTHTGISPRVFTYVLTASNENCSASDTVNITVDPGPQARFRFSPDPVSSEDPRIFFNNTSVASETTTFFWDFSGLGTSTSRNPDFRFPEGTAGDYAVTLNATDQLTGCSDSYSANVRVRNQMLVYVPNAFTPDGDGKNDLWGPVTTNLDPRDYKLTVYDRWGSVVFETTDINQKWNGGKMNGGYYQEAGMYIYVIEGREIGAIDDFEMRGNVFLLR